MLANTVTLVVAESPPSLMIGLLRTMLGLVAIIDKATNSSLISLYFPRTNPPSLHCNACATVSLHPQPSNFIGRSSISNPYLILNPSLSSYFERDGSFTTVGIIESQAHVSVLRSTFCRRSFGISCLSFSRVLVWLDRMLVWTMVFSSVMVMISVRRLNLRRLRRNNMRMLVQAIDVE